jgi:plasmid stabilization system protein ParE
MIVALSDEAEHELEQIADYIAQDNPRRAFSFVRELRAKCEALAFTPNGFPLLPRYEDSGIRRSVHGNYVIFYQVEAERIFVLHVLNGAMDYGAVLFGE